MSTSGSFAGGRFCAGGRPLKNPFLTGWPVQQSAGSSPLSTRCAPARTDEDVLTYALLPATAADFLKRKYGVERAMKQQNPEKLKTPKNSKKGAVAKRKRRNRPFARKKPVTQRYFVEILLKTVGHQAKEHTAKQGCPPKWTAHFLRF